MVWQSHLLLSLGPLPGFLVFYGLPGGILLGLLLCYQAGLFLLLQQQATEHYIIGALSCEYDL